MTATLIITLLVGWVVLGAALAVVIGRVLGAADRELDLPVTEFEREPAASGARSRRTAARRTAPPRAPVGPSGPPSR